MNAWVVFFLTWAANVGSGAAVYALARKHGPAISGGVLGRRILTPNTMANIAEQYRRHGVYGIFFSRLLPIWRAVVMPFAGMAGVSPARALIPMALASGAYYGALIYLLSRLGNNLDAVLLLLRHVNTGLGIVAGTVLLIIVVWIVRRRLRRPPEPPPPEPPAP